MADERGYEARVMPQAAAPLPMASARTYGAELGDAIENVGQDLHRRDLRAYQVQRQQRADQEASDFAHRYALHRENMDGIVRQLRANPTSPDYAEHVALVEKADDAAREGLLSGISEDSLRRRAVQQLDEFRVRLGTGEAEFAEGQRVAKTTLDAKAVMDLGSNRVRRLQTGSEYAGEVQDWYGYVDGLQGLTPVAKQKLRLEGAQEYTVAFVNHLNDTNPAAAIAMLDAGTFDEMLSPQQVEQLRNGSQVELRRAEAQLVHQANLEKAAAKEEIATATELSSQGIDVSEQLPGLIAKAAAMGDTSTVAKLQGMARDSAFARVWGTVSPLQRQARLQALQAIPEGKRTENDQAELKWHEGPGRSADSRFTADKAGFALETAPAGMGPPAIENWGNASELVRREKWMRGAVDTYGSMDPLTGAEVKALQDRASGSDVGYREVLSSLGSGFSGRTAMQAVRQVLPSDAFAQSVVALAPNVQRQALDGRNERKSFPQVLKPRLGADGKPDDEVVRDLSGLRAGFARALGNVPAAQRNGILEVAEAIAANALVKNGQTSDQLDGAMFARALDAALGSTGSGPTKKGGIGWWGGSMYLLPSSVSQSGFDTHISNWLRAHPDQAPVNPDGSPANVRAARPLAIGGDRYQFMVGNRVLMGKDGKPWIRTVTAK
ncbi:hypothetical protein [Novosphingobium guangzhouense]|uniref:Uncharacterized protein n=1 Tax=Novosphingobium guangzhouense TaxID=1850347 RepID=A0A2K2G442_9SPHN|nr:hypothetical protein [Novosphingobium guangzhouense]PNU05804.1 hypothetical protein A8V01_14660 [Novosphingobium guangzhouense]